MCTLDRAMYYIVTYICYCTARLAIIGNIHVYNYM